MINVRSFSLLSSWLKIGCFVAAATVVVPFAGAVERSLRVDAPRFIKEGAVAKASVIASTDAKDGEKIGFLHAEASVDDGKTWTALCYLDKGSKYEARNFDLPAAPAGGKIIIRARVAFRDGAAGDVDFKGERIKWDETWNNWSQPPAKQLVLAVRK
ncbi:hypothetical protein [Oleiharenicola lentus]|uniref:hypothetical protein n=1 Tax=Oleiharenicola lentus TaxID=2508720 RepID=UPI003F678FE4